MVAELHVRGYQRLRIAPYLGPNGHWRCVLAPVRMISSLDGAKCDDRLDEASLDVARYTIATGNEYWGWKDTAHCTPGQLADVFLERWPELAAQSYGADWLYAGWYQEMLHITYPDDLPIAFSEFDDGELAMRSLHDRVIPKPPVGMADDAHRRRAD